MRLCAHRRQNQTRKIEEEKKNEIQRTSVLDVGVLWLRNQTRGHHDHHDKPTMFEEETQ